MNPLYKFTLDESTGKISVQEITEYTEGKWTNRRTYWRYKGKSCWMYIYEEKLDKYLNGHVYSFNSSIVDARLIIADAIYARAEKAKREAKRWSKVYDLIFK